MLHGIKNMNKFELNRIEMKLIYLYVLHLIKHIYRFYRIRRLFSFPTLKGQLNDKSHICYKTLSHCDILSNNLICRWMNRQNKKRYHRSNSTMSCLFTTIMTVKFSNTQLLIYCIYNLDRAYCLQLLIIKKVSIRKRLEFKPQFQICQMITRKDEIHELHFFLEFK